MFRVLTLRQAVQATQAVPILLATQARRVVPILLALAAAGCGTAGVSGAAGSPGAAHGPVAVRTDVPEPAKAPPLTERPAGTVVAMPGAPEGLAVDDPDGILAVGLRRPDAVALVNVTTGRVRRVIRLPGAPRHLQLAGPAGPVLVPAEQVDQLFQLALPGGQVVADTHVGHQPHDAAAAGPVVFVGNEYSNTVSLVRDGKQVAVEPGPCSLAVSPPPATGRPSWSSGSAAAGSRRTHRTAARWVRPRSASAPPMCARPRTACSTWRIPKATR